MRLKTKTEVAAELLLVGALLVALERLFFSSRTKYTWPHTFIVAPYRQETHNAAFCINDTNWSATQRTSEVDWPNSALPHLLHDTMWTWGVRSTTLGRPTYEISKTGSVIYDRCRHANAARPVRLQGAYPTHILATYLSVGTWYCIHSWGPSTCNLQSHKGVL